VPKRTTPFQMVVAFVRKHWAPDDLSVTESKYLRDSHLGIDREVDVVVEGDFDGEPVVTSIEVIEHSRPASVTWVEQQVAKHRYLSTNRLVLISKSGFTKNALKAVAAEGGWVDAVRPEIVEVDGEPVVERLHVDQMELEPTRCRLHVQRPDSSAVVVEGLLEGAICTVFDGDGVERGSALQLAYEVLHIDWLREHFSREAHDHPERDELKGFSCGIGLGELGYYLRDDETGELHSLMMIDVEGRFYFTQTELAFAQTELGDRRFGVGEGLLLGRQTIWVQTAHEAAGTAKLSWRTKDDAPLRERPVGVPSEPQFPELSTLRPPEDWSGLPGTSPRE
jgi:hypothetical protein